MNVLRRSVLSVPGHVAKMHLKASQSAADVVMLDLEDSVPLDEKSAARDAVVASLTQVDWGHRQISVRINAIETPLAYQDLIAVVERAGHHLYSIVAPKVDHPGDIHFVDRLLSGIEQRVGIDRPIGIEASIESAAGLNAVSDIAAAGKRLVSLVFGIADYSASIGARLVSISGHGENEDQIYPGHRWHFALSRMVMAAKANGLKVIDAPYGNFKDVDGLTRAAAMGCALGCDGKWAIHPTQIEPINTVFTPAGADIQRAQRIVAAAEAAQQAGRGAVALDGRMIDQATLRLARQLCDAARALAKPVQNAAS